MKISLTIGLLALLACSMGCAGTHVGASYPIGRASVGIGMPLFRSLWTRVLHYQTIFEAATNGDTYDIKTHLLRGAAVNAHDGAGRTPLHLAAMNGHYKACKYLISKGGNVNGVDNQGLSPYDYADEKGYEDVTTLLVKHGGS